MSTSTGHQTLAGRLRLSILVTMGCLLVLAGTANLAYTSWATYQDTKYHANSTALGVGMNLAAALTFNDREGAQEILASLKAKPDVVAATVYDASGATFATYVAQDSPEGHVTVQAPILQSGTREGSISITVRNTRLWNNLIAHGTASAILLLAVMLIALPISNHVGARFIQPIRRLNEVISTVASKRDLGLRVDVKRDDEIGTLVGHFNEMLARLQQGDTRLRVAQRMARLGYWELEVDSGSFALSDELADICRGEDNAPPATFAEFRELFQGDDRERFDTDVASAIHRGTSSRADYQLQLADESLLHVHQQIEIDGHGTPAAKLIATAQDITRQKDAEEQIRKLAYFDPLTGLASRSYLFARLDDMVRTARLSGKSFALFFMDLDMFKDINDTLGHQAGDELLKVVAERLLATLRKPDFVARLGGDEFCMLLDDVSEEDDIEGVARRCMAAVEVPVELSTRTIRPQFSVGISRFPADGEDAYTIMQAADSAMYAAKEAGKNQFKFFRKSMTNIISKRLALAQELREALKDHQFELYYQPQIALDSGRVIAYEALVRWNHPQRGIVMPNDFIPDLEGLGLINELGNWAIFEACQQLSTWQKEGLAPTKVSVNISPSHLQTDDLLDVVRTALDLNDTSPDQLEIEVTETGIQSAERATRVLQALKEIGVYIAIDDFGTGYSSLGSLQQLPIDCLKIDRVFVKDILTSPKDSVLLGTIMTLAHALGFRVVAEGVETLAQIQVLRGLGCDVAQGFYFSKAVIADEVPKLNDTHFIPELENIVEFVSNG